MKHFILGLITLIISTNLIAENEPLFLDSITKTIPMALPQDSIPEKNGAISNNPKKNWFEQISIRGYQQVRYN